MRSGAGLFAWTPASELCSDCVVASLTAQEVPFRLTIAQSSGTMPTLVQ